MTVESRWFLYDELLESVSAAALVRRCAYGKHWLMVESDQGGIGLAQRFTPAHIVPAGLNVEYNIVGQPLKSVAARIKSWNFNEASIGLAALNAANNNLAEGGALRKALDTAQGDAFDFFLQQTQGKKVTVIGHFPYLKKLRAQCELSILERQPQPGDLPDTAAEYILPEQDFVYITGTTFINKTITRLLELSRRAVVCMVGPSTPMNSLLFRHGLASLSGLIVNDYQDMVEALQGERCEAIFGKAGRKVNLINKDCQ